jgi:hypothetical protein
MANRRFRTRVRHQLLLTSNLEDIVGHLLIENSLSAGRNRRKNLHRAGPLMALILTLIGSSGLVAAQTSPLQACKENKCVQYCQGLSVQKTELAQCVTQCKDACLPPPPTVTVTPKYFVWAVAYAPPGCSQGSTPAPNSLCGASNGSSLVDYGGSSANGTKVTTKDSFQKGETVSLDASFIPGPLSANGSYGIQDTSSDSTTTSVTKTTTNDWKVFGNGDGVDHGQDQFYLMLHPQVKLEARGSQVLWGIVDGGAPYVVYASELRNLAFARPSTISVLGEVGLTAADYQSILDTDPYGGTVLAGGNGSTTVGVNLGTPATNQQESGTGAPGSELDPKRFWYTGLSFPYQPGLPSSTCNNGLCNCDSYSGGMTNDNMTVNETSDESQTTVDMQAGLTVPDAFALKSDTKLVWTNSSTTDNSTEKTSTANATVTCPSTNYPGPYGMQVWWDSRYGSFVLIPYDPGAVPTIHRGQIVDASGQPVRGQLVTLTYGGKTHRTYTARDGSYGFPLWSGAPKFIGTAQVETRGLKQTIDLGAKLPLVMKMK